MPDTPEPPSAEAVCARERCGLPRDHVVHVGAPVMATSGGADEYPVAAPDHGFEEPEADAVAAARIEWPALLAYLAADTGEIVHGDICPAPSMRCSCGLAAAIAAAQAEAPRVAARAQMELIEAHQALEHQYRVLTHRIVELEAEVPRVAELEAALALDTPYPLHEILGYLADATEILLTEHQYTIDGHEKLSLSVDAARTMVRTLAPGAEEGGE